MAGASTPGAPAPRPGMGPALRPGSGPAPRPGSGPALRPGSGPALRPGALPAGLGRDALIAEVAARCSEHIAAGARVLVAVSGGPDSTALAHLVAEARPDLDLVIGHVRHGLRDDAADAATAAVHAAALGVSYAERRVQVEPRDDGLEAAARRVRYAALGRLAAEAGAQAVLVAHTADDQAETVLLNLARGTGLHGAAGMRAARPLAAPQGTGVADPADARGSDVRLPGADPDDLDLVGVALVRPLLRVRRADVRSHLAGEGLQAVEDPTNADLRRRRARARHQVLPALASLAGGPGDPVGSLTRFADLARADADALEDLADQAAGRVLRRWGPTRCVRTDDLAGLPPALATRVVRRLLDRGGPPPPARVVLDVLGLEPGQARHDVGMWITCGGGWLAAAPESTGPLAACSLVVPGAALLPAVDVAVCTDLPWGADAAALPGQQRLALDITTPPLLPAARAAAELVPAALADPPPAARPTGTGMWTVLDARCAPVAARARRPGDRIRLAVGTRTLADVLTDQGVPRALRDLLPVVVDAHDEPLWLPGVAVRVAPRGARGAVRIWIAPGTGSPWPGGVPGPPGG